VLIFETDLLLEESSFCCKFFFLCGEDSWSAVGIVPSDFNVSKSESNRDLFVPRELDFESTSSPGNAIKV